MGNSNSKFQDMREESRVLAEKIKYQINSYKMRRLVASDDIADIARVRRSCGNNDDMQPVWQLRIEKLKQEVAFCDNQILAYQNNDDKAKIIPDRLL